MASASRFGHRPRQQQRGPPIFPQPQATGVATAGLLEAAAILDWGGSADYHGLTDPLYANPSRYPSVFLNCEYKKFWPKLQVCCRFLCSFYPWWRWVDERVGCSVQ